MKKKKVAAIICSTLIVAGCILSLFEESYSGIADIDPSWDTVEGTILTSDGTVICECTEDHHRGTVRSPEIYGSLLGHNSEGYGRSGLRRQLADKLYATDEKKPARGNDVVLTINDSVQTFAYNLMLPFLHEENRGTHKREDFWGCLDQIIVSRALLNSDSACNTIHVKDGKAHIFCADFMIEPDEKYGGFKLIRTFSGPRYIGGYADHLPVYIDLNIDYRENINLTPPRSP